MTQTKSTHIALLVLGVLIVLGAAGYGVYAYDKLKAEKLVVENTLHTTQITLADTQGQNALLNNQLLAAQNTVDAFSSQVNGIANTVGTLQKLQNTDKELLEKYSKIYFLNENYVPASLALIDQNYLYNKDKPLEFHAQAAPFLENLLNAASAAGLHLEVESAYRSFGTQSTLKAAYKMTYGAGTANSFSADQGYSEHQLGTALDFTTPKIGDSFAGFEKTDEYTWLQNNAYRFGFILSYPKDNAYYTFEPWHWRFVGVALATTLHTEGKNFYDLDQREIDTYLVNIFD